MNIQKRIKEIKFRLTPADIRQLSPADIRQLFVSRSAEKMFADLADASEKIPGETSAEKVWRAYEMLLGINKSHS
jgi:ribosome biogenesis protein Nip4